MITGTNRKSVVLALARAEAMVLRGEAILLAQKARIIAARHAGRDTERFKNQLSVWEETQRLHVANRDRLRKIINADRP
jgi:hypothetical protein